MKWYDQFAEAVGDARVVIAFEPDSLGTIDCLAPAPPRRPHAHAAPRRGRALAAAQRDHLPRGGRLRLGAGQRAPPSSCARSAWARCAASCSTSPTTTGRAPTSSTAWRSRASWAASTSSSTRATTAAGRSTTASGSTARAHLAHDQRLVPPRPARPRPAADHGHLAPAGGRLHVHQPARLLGRRLQRRPAPDRHLVARPRADVREVRDRLGGARRAGTRYGHFRRYSLRALGAFSTELDSARLARRQRTLAWTGSGRAARRVALRLERLRLPRLRDPDQRRAVGLLAVVEPVDAHRRARPLVRGRVVVVGQVEAERAPGRPRRRTG